LAGALELSVPRLLFLKKIWRNNLTDWIKSFTDSFPAESWSVDKDELTRYSRDAWPVVIKLGQIGPTPYLPQLVFHPRYPQEVTQALTWANQHRIPVTAWGAGSGVVGAALPTQGGILLDLSRLNKILVLDEVNLLVKVQAGIMGHNLEAELNSRGFTLNHSPQSLDRSTVGGWIATRACGQFSSRWGGIEDFTLALTVALANGETFSTRLSPRAAIGPDIKNLFIGSEGTLGVILDVTLKIFPLAQTRLLETISFPSVESGLSGMRRLMQTGLRPFLIRFYDTDESLLVARWSGVTPLPGANLFILGCEGLTEMAQAEYRAAIHILESEGGEKLGPEIAQGWMEHRFDFSGVENRLALPGGVAETIEVASLWDGIFETYTALKQDLAPFAEHVLGHFSHSYPQGVSLYIILLGEVSDAQAAESRLREIWDVAMRTSMEHGATISHHHGIGLARQKYLRQELGPSYAILERVKNALDPQGILNPGKLAFRR
jgi:alkyldihydroxyacetonephosphate synthase